MARTSPWSGPAALGLLLVVSAVGAAGGSARAPGAREARAVVLSPSLGMRIDGRRWRGYAGAFVAGAGDVNGDGLRDVLVGTNEIHRSGPGLPAPRYSAYVVFGRRGPRGRVVRLDRLGAGGLRIVRRNAGFGFGPGYSGAGVAAAGDVNGDGLGDLVLGTDSPSSTPGRPLAYVVYGRRRGGTVDVGRLGGGGFVVRPAAGGVFSGTAAVAGAGDLDRDGFADVLIGERDYGSAVGRVGAGRVLVIYGARRTAGIDTRRLGIRGTRILGSDPVPGPDGRIFGPWFGGSLAGLGDANGDGRRDLLIGAPNLRGMGGAYVVTGPRRRRATIDLRRPVAGAYLISGQRRDLVGWSVASAGDQNGDGLQDLLLGGLPGGDSLLGSSGPSEAYVVYGRRGARDLALGELGSRGAVLRDATSGDRAGQSVAGVGDVTGDGRPDLLVGAPLADPRGVRAAGSAFLVAGGRLAPVVDLRRAQRRFDGVARFDTAGSWVAGLGDVNGDRIPDVAIAAPRTDVLALQSGSVYVVYGER